MGVGPWPRLWEACWWQELWVTLAAQQGQVTRSIENRNCTFENQKLKSGLCYLHSKVGYLSVFPNLTHDEVALA